LYSNGGYFIVENGIVKLMVRLRLELGWRIRSVLYYFRGRLFCKSVSSFQGTALCFVLLGLENKIT